MSSWNPGDQSGQPPQYGQQPPQGQPPQQQPPHGSQPPSFEKPSNPPPSYGQPPQHPGQSYGAPNPGYGSGQPAYAGGAYPPPNPYGSNASGQPGLPPGAVQPLSMGNRVVAFIIDGAILYVLGLVAVLILFLGVLGSAASCSGSYYDTNGNYVGADCSAGAGIGVIVTFIIFLILWIGVLVFWVYMLGKSGQTPGKRIMGVKVVDNDNGQPIGFGRAFLRYVVQYFANFLCYAGLWSAWLDGPPAGRYRGWHDKAVNSVVISIK